MAVLYKERSDYAIQRNRSSPRVFGRILIYEPLLHLERPDRDQPAGVSARHQRVGTRR